MKIVMTTSSFPRSSKDWAGVFVLSLARELVRRGHRVTVAAPHAPGLARREVIDGVQVVRFRYMYPERLEALAYGRGMVTNVRRRPWLFFLVPCFLAAQSLVLRSLVPDADVVATHWLLPQGMVARLCGISSVVILHGSDVHLARGRVARFFARWTLSGASAVVANSTATAHRAKEIARSVSVRIIPMGVEVERFSPPTDDSKKRPQRIGIAPRIVSVGRLIPLKGYRYLIEAMGKIRSTFPDASLTLVGNGPERRELERLAETLGVGTAVTCTGEVGHFDVPGILWEHDLFILPAVITETGETEGLGTVMLEAMAAHLPVAASDVGGIPDIVEHETTGLLFPQRDPDAIAEAVIRLAGDDNLRDRIVEAARKRVRERFFWPVIAEQYEELFRIYGNEIETHESDR